METRLVYKAHEHLRLWQPVQKIIPPEKLFNPADVRFPLFSFLYQKTKALYGKVPPRKNGRNPFLHPLNVFIYLKKAKIDDFVTLAAGLLHDYVEEEVDLYRREKGIKENREGILRLDKYESEMFKKLEDDLLQFCIARRLDGRLVPEIVRTLKLLTRHKRHFYLRYLSSIFNCPERKLKERAIHIKLADVMHNVQSIESFDEPGRLYACFKSLFILNNTKKHLLDYYGKDYLVGLKYCPMEKLFNKCARDTYDAFLTICRICSEKGIYPVRTLLQLAFKKFELLNEGLWEVTKVDAQEIHPLRLYQAVVRKYDAWLRHEFDKYEEMKKDEEEYCRNFFLDYHFTKEQLNAILCYKDAFSLKEVIAYLIYRPDYFISRFLCGELSRKGRIKR